MSKRYQKLKMVAAYSMKMCLSMKKKTKKKKLTGFPATPTVPGSPASPSSPLDRNI